MCFQVLDDGSGNDPDDVRNDEHDDRLGILNLFGTFQEMDKLVVLDLLLKGKISFTPKVGRL